MFRVRLTREPWTATITWNETLRFSGDPDFVDRLRVMTQEPIGYWPVAGGHVRRVQPDNERHAWAFVLWLMKSEFGTIRVLQPPTPPLKTRGIPVDIRLSPEARAARDFFLTPEPVFESR